MIRNKIITALRAMESCRSMIGMHYNSAGDVKVVKQTLTKLRKFHKQLETFSFEGNEKDIDRLINDCYKLEDDLLYDLYETDEIIIEVLSEELYFCLDEY